MNETVDDVVCVVQLSESYPMRRAAQLTAYIFFRGKAIGEHYCASHFF